MTNLQILDIIFQMNRSKTDSYGTYDISVLYTFYKAFTVSSLRAVTIPCIKSILYNFFFRQYRANLLPGRVPVSLVDDPLDKKIPFIPLWVNIYIDFTFLWIRMLGFLLRKYRFRSYTAVREFIVSIGKLYAFAAESYKKNFSTTKRPFYIARPRFFVIHLVDPHLMCIPSLHVMLAIITYTRFALMLRSLNEEKNNKAQIEELKQGALAISKAVLYVKQHSINCISAALYAMTCFDEKLFPPHEAEAFASILLKPSASGKRKKKQKNQKVRPEAAPHTNLPEAEVKELTAHIINLYRRFLNEKNSCQNWEEPLLNFMRRMPPAL